MLVGPLKREPHPVPYTCLLTPRRPLEYASTSRAITGNARSARRGPGTVGDEAKGESEQNLREYSLRVKLIGKDIRTVL
jgi:hypothetical protein